mmetsp:Transcript_19542/g.35378  ORF Transcript_19542/g.35378 Transcript_19542/m.35378 type:complete len:245 (+) Transcript_19542:366-1100(+)|eukprot:CAMPEP_0201865450 /NCGR_PEP_ID=MMETSP0902-20130614/328_1 /ASSEMBLY_ACC=CAM_ASM_000551 /TAXON_ID=420261 /ORGANISM="Thalassiosira antarctica, Strain CCMP982" /LENGTH=244 /DNA_ID=CAMNT_0048390199 /DNA_START=326 /DNA_END=1060 /DNA_ORIENTATION=-
MINRQALIVVLAAAATVQNAHAFTTSSPYSIHQCPLRTTTLYNSAAASNEEDVELTRQVIMDHIDTPEEDEKLIMDIPPMPATAVEPAATPKPAAAAKTAPKKKGSSHKEGVFSPIVVAAGTILGDKQLNKIRGKFIAIHSDLIKTFVGTSDSDVGQAVLRQIFTLVDTDKSGYLDKDEIAVALNLLGFKWLKEKQVEKIFERADANGDTKISLEEFMAEAPKTLKVNLVKLAKANGGDMGLLV